MDDPKAGIPLTLVADNSALDLQQQRALKELEWLEETAANSIRQLAVNLLRVIAGAGEPWALLRHIDEARTAYIAYIEAAKKAGRQAKPLTDDIILDRLFSNGDGSFTPRTEQEWQRWAQPADPHDEYFDSKFRAKLALRRAALRQIASVLNSRDNREPSLTSHGGDLDEIIESIFSAKERLRQQRLRPPERVDPERQAIAEQKISELRQEQRRLQLESLPPHQVEALRAVDATNFDKTDSFTLDVLGRMNLLARPTGNKKKSAWRLTKDGRLALDIHNKIRR